MRDDGTPADGRLLAKPPLAPCGIVAEALSDNSGLAQPDKIDMGQSGTFCQRLSGTAVLEHSGTFELGRLRSLLLTLMARLGISTPLVWHFSLAPHCFLVMSLHCSLYGHVGALLSGRLPALPARTPAWELLFGNLVADLLGNLVTLPWGLSWEPP